MTFQQFGINFDGDFIVRGYFVKEEDILNIDIRVGSIDRADQGTVIYLNKVVKNTLALDKEYFSLLEHQCEPNRRQRIAYYRLYL